MKAKTVASRAEIRALQMEEMEAMLWRNHVGRIAFSLRDRVDIEPIHYVYRDGSIFGRTSEGTKLTKIAHNYWVAFEVDEVDGLFTWKSLVLHGGFYQLSADSQPELYERALSALRELFPDTLRRGDPFPKRDVVFRIVTQEWQGRTCE